MGSSFQPTQLFGFSGTDLSDRIIAGFRTCFGIDLQWAGRDRSLTSISVCPELTFSVTQQSVSVVPDVAVELRQTSDAPDSELCFKFLSFETDGDLDVLNQDEPYAEGCFYGRCVSTSSTNRFNGNIVTWDEGPHCVPVRRRNLAITNVTIHLLERDSSFHDQYAMPPSLRLTSGLCPELASESGCPQTLELTPLAGTFARVSAVFTLRSLPRLLAGASVAGAPTSEPRCSGISVGLQGGLSASFGGIQFPNWFSSGAEQVLVDPVSGDLVQPQEAFFQCLPVSTDAEDDDISAARRHAFLKPSVGAGLLLFLAISIHSP